MTVSAPSRRNNEMKARVLPRLVKCRLILVRHAAAKGDGRFQGQLDAQLSKEGRDQLPALVVRLSRYPIQAIYSSDLSRARETAAAIALKCRLPVNTYPELREMHFGQWQGRTWEEIARGFPEHARSWVERFPRARIPGAESFTNFRRRSVKILERIAKNHKRRCVLVVTHAGLIRAFLADTLRMKAQDMLRLPQDHGDVSIVDYMNGNWVVRCINA